MGEVAIRGDQGNVPLYQDTEAVANELLLFTAAATEAEDDKGANLN